MILQEATALEVYQKVYAEKIPEKVFHRLLVLDPTTKNAESDDLNTIIKGKYSDWLIKQFFAAGEPDKLLMLNEDAEDIYDSLDLYNKLLRNKAGIEQLEKLIKKATITSKNPKDIGSFTIHDLRLLHATFKEQGESLEKSETEKETDITIIYEDKLFRAVSPKTHEAARKYGTGTNWCTATANPHHYVGYTKTNSKHGPLIIIIDKKGEPPDNKWQYHEASEQFMNYKNQRIHKYTFILSQIKKGPQYEESVDKVAAAIEKWGNDPSWDYDNITEENGISERIEKLISSGQLVAAFEELAKDDELNAAIIESMFNDFDADISDTANGLPYLFMRGNASDMENLDKLAEVSGTSVSRLFLKFLKSAQTQENSGKLQEAIYRISENDFFRSYLIPQLTQQDILKILNFLQDLIKSSFTGSPVMKIDNLLFDLLSSMKESIQEARALRPRVEPVEILKKYGSKVIDEKYIIGKFTQIFKEEINAFPKSQEWLATKLGITSFAHEHDLWKGKINSQEIKNTSSAQITLSPKGKKKMISKLGKEEILNTIAANCMLALHITPDFELSEDSDTRWDKFVQKVKFDKDFDVSTRQQVYIVLYILSLFSFRGLSSDTIMTLGKAARLGGATVASMLWMYTTYDYWKLYDFFPPTSGPANRVTISNTSREFEQKISSFSSLDDSASSYPEPTKALCAVAKSSLVDVQYNSDDLKKGPHFYGSEVNLTLNEAIDLIKQRKLAASTMKESIQQFLSPLTSKGILNG